MHSRQQQGRSSRRSLRGPGRSNAATAAVPGRFVQTPRAVHQSLSAVLQRVVARGSALTCMGAPREVGVSASSRVEPRPRLTAKGSGQL